VKWVEPVVMAAAVVLLLLLGWYVWDVLHRVAAEDDDLDRADRDAVVEEAVERTVNRQVAEAQRQLADVLMQSALRLFLDGHVEAAVMLERRATEFEDAAAQRETTSAPDRGAQVIPLEGRTPKRQQRF
jgi:hypothetical protein